MSDNLQIRTTQHATAKAIMVSAVAAIGGFLFGFDTAVINGAVDAIQATFALSSVVTGFAVSCALLGSALGAWWAGPAANRLGRVRVMVVAAALFASSAVGSGMASGVASLIFWRVLAGIGVGVASVIAPAYIAEIAPAHLRGRLASLQQLAIVTGIFAALLSDAYVARSAGGAREQSLLGFEAWRWMFFAGIVPSLAYGILALAIPESPRHLVMRGHHDQAAAVLRQVLGTDDVDAKVLEIARTLKRDDAPSLADLRGPARGLLPIVWIGITLSVFQQFVGINVIFYYSTTLWRSVGFTEADALTTSVITSITNVAVTLVAISLVDRVGRKPLLLVGSAGMAVTLAVMAYCFSHSVLTAGQVSLPPPLNTIALVAANAYVVFFGVSWGPVVWVLLGEMFSNRIRAAALAVAAAAQWIANFVVTITFPVLAQDMSLAFAYGVYAACAAASFAFVMKWVRETKGMELEAISH